VSQVTVAVVTEVEEAMFEITGPVTSGAAVVMSDVSLEVDVLLEASLDTTT
jgi:hypothetical protein